ncbi:MAG: hypothetical protein ACRDU8_01625 [Egibacteraceae bacterium]
MTETLPPAYPHELSELVHLDDGTPLELRAIRPDDDDRLERVWRRLSPQTLYRRFFMPVAEPTPAVLHRLAAAGVARGVRTFSAEVLADNRPMMGLLAVLGDPVETSLSDGAYTVRLQLPERVTVRSRPRGPAPR